MSLSDENPELDGYVPHGERPLRSRAFKSVMRVVVVLGLIGLVVPGIVSAAGTANNTAHRTCAIYTEYLAPQAVSYDVRFALTGDGDPGWKCYAISFNGSETLLRSLGLIPGPAVLPTSPADNT
ncbi:hypothetical protein ESZ53_13065 [Salinibacterium sp. UTAS2018]|uniref:hypothetical protein n=1 Tax=Salinibacterium sp. UTAS2018 TaxID=2508880 RepID=UPI00100982D4|nr:hypothetical protein [Salinibacterium sp. UTAS2018]QAV71689.1 hypothetical protein ESZ53_13065 [Salinibacterium sp. UTAS2018]